jgi:hypothetical protein
MRNYIICAVTDGFFPDVQGVVDVPAGGILQRLACILAGGRNTTLDARPRLEIHTAGLGVKAGAVKQQRVQGIFVYAHNHHSRA